MSMKKILLGGALSAALSAGIVTTAFAASAVTNGSFETGTDPGVFSTLLAGNTTDLPGWTVASGSVDYIGSYWTASDGARSLDMSGFNAGAVSQTFPTVVGHTYTVAFDMAGNPAGPPAVKTLAVDVGGAPTNYTFDTTGQSLTDMGWKTQTYSFTATGISTTLTFASQDNTFYGPALDNVVVTDTLMNKDQCKQDGWKAFSDPSFKNQGDCVSYMQSNVHAIGNKSK
ncbi:MAG TPA: choice-of-anchor C family protein [Patescibacteria group bacterium]|nr:choice-of-anchor C family protein [Patescibacteria group bacterium]